MRAGAVEISPDLHRAHIDAARAVTNITKEIHNKAGTLVSAELHNKPVRPAVLETRRRGVVLGEELTKAAQMGVLRVPYMAAVQALMHTQHIHSYQLHTQPLGVVDISF